MKTLMMVIAVILLAVACGSDVTGPAVPIDVVFYGDSPNDSTFTIDCLINGKSAGWEKDCISSYTLKTVAFPGDTLSLKIMGLNIEPYADIVVNRFTIDPDTLLDDPSCLEIQYVIPE